MDKLGLLKARKESLTAAGEDIRKKIASLVDVDSFVELDSYSFSRNEFYGEDVPGEGVVCGFAAINDFAVYVVAINGDVLSGGLTNAGCKKIVKCLDKAEKASAPVIYILSSNGVAVGEGVSVLEGIAEVLCKMQQLNGNVTQFSISVGDVLGSASLFVSACDYNYYMKGACVSYVSPLVIAAKAGVSLDKEAIGGAKSAEDNALCSFAVEEMIEARSSISDILDVLPLYGGELLETGDDLNRFAPALNEKASGKDIVEAVFDKDYFIELGKGYAKEVITGIGRIGGFSAAAIVFDGEEGVTLNLKNIKKLNEFYYFCADNDLPVVTFVNTLGLCSCKEVSASTVLKEINSLIYAFNYESPRINVIYGKAIGLGYTLFGSKAFGTDYSFAFANAEVSVVNSEEGAEIEFAANGGDKAAIKARFEQDGMDAMNAAKCGYIDDVIEPQYVRSYVISALQMLIRG
ncbi:MAG: hypothetical protein J6U25_02615 [Clostridia bacterium]|nr:hypothetical protein [Clostridia bacterium]